ncbi:hypothetical protein ACOSP6_09075 [Tenacibaculum sp. MEBiC06402]|uniref:hypothetical protein n=1 Tax=unclassified Tenacibaculum TaxID=2635139 RepID=UPI003B9C79BF
MKTPFLTYFFAITLITSIALPTYLSLSENACEYSLVINDFEDDSEQTEKNLDTDVKIIHSFQEMIAYKSVNTENNIVFLSREYSALSLKVDSPPPEFFS